VPNREYNRNGRNVCPCTHWRWGPNERFIDDIVDAYEKAYTNLKGHSKRYPECRSAVALRELVALVAARERPVLGQPEAAVARTRARDRRRGSCVR
jgi:hypothetical protein